VRLGGSLRMVDAMPDDWLSPLTSHQTAQMLGELQIDLNHKTGSS
jgi:hypothetical protein